MFRDKFTQSPDFSFATHDEKYRQCLPDGDQDDGNG
jgi:hypothetical protein